MATVTVTAHHNSSWKQKNGKWVKTKDKKDLKESRKVSSDIGRAFLNKTSKKSKNSHTDGKSLYLHGHEIAKHGENGAVHGTMAGLPTKTTKDRLNAISNDRFHTKKGKHYYGDKEIGERDWVQIKEAIRIMVEGAIKDLETKDEEEKRLLKINKPKKIMNDKERSQFKGLQKKDLKEDQLEEAKKLYVRKVQGDSRTRRNKKAWDLAFNPKKPVSFFDELKAINAKKEQEKKDLKEGVGHYSVKKTHTRNNPDDMSDDDVYENDGNDGSYTEYDIHKDGKKVGELKHHHYFGDILGKLHGKHLPELSGYGKKSKSGPQSSLHAFLKSRTGKKWASNLHKYMKEDDETASRYKKALADSKGSITKDGEELVKKRINQLQNKDLKEGFFSGKSLKPTKKGTKLIKRLTNEGVGRYLDKATGNQKRRIKNKLKHHNSMVSTPLSKIATNNKRLQRLEK